MKSSPCQSFKWTPFQLVLKFESFSLSKTHANTTIVPFAGNPAAVCLVDNGTCASNDDFSNIAAEMNLSETAFVTPIKVKCHLLYT